MLEREPVRAREEERPRIEQIEDRLEEQPAEGIFKLIGPDGQALALPEPLVRLLRQIVRVLAQGGAVSIVPLHKELTTQEAADLLNVSRQYLVQLLERGEIPFHKVGSHRRVAFGELMEYKRRRDEKRRRGLRRLTQMSQDMGLYR